MRDLTFESYQELLDAFVSSGRRVGGVEDWLGGVLQRDGAVILRHDVDRRVSKSISMARLEKEFGVRSTYYVRAGRSGFPADVVRTIASLGHYVGYHYETLSQCRGDVTEAIRVFEENLSKLRSLVDCRSVCMHGAPLSCHDNRDLLRGGRWKEFDLMGDAVLSLESAGLLYLTDTGGQLGNGGRMNLRDTLPRSPDLGVPLPRSTREVVELVRGTRIPLYLNIHPERWALGRWDKVYCGGADHVANWLKLLTKVFRCV